MSKKEYIKSKELKIGNLKLKNNIIVAPMAGVTNKAFRQIANEIAGPAYIVNEMVSAKALTFNDEKTFKMLEKYEGEEIFAVQLFGNEPDIIKEAAKIVKDKTDANILDINMGCPAPKIVKNGSGSEILTDIDLARSIVRAVREVWDKTLTVKIRIGKTKDNIVAIDFTKMLCEEGVDMIAIHGRTAEDFHKNKINTEIIKKCKEISTVPVIVNGGIFCYNDAIEILEETNADGIMIGRCAFQDIFELRNIVKSFEIGKNIKIDYTIEDAKQFAKKHYILLKKLHGLETAVKEIRKNIIWYSKGFPNSSKVREKVHLILDDKSFEEVLNMF